MNNFNNNIIIHVLFTYNKKPTNDIILITLNIILWGFILFLYSKSLSNNWNKKLINNNLLNEKNGDLSYKLQYDTGYIYTDFLIDYLIYSFFKY